MRKVSLVLGLFFVCAVLIVPGKIFADIFDLTISSEGSSYHESYSSVDSIMDSINEDYIRRHIPHYTDMSAATGDINFRGVPVSLSFMEGSSELMLSIPSIGVEEIFMGHTRDDSVDQLEEWFESEGGSALTRLMQALAANTPNDPIAGNPNSLMANIVETDFDSAFTSNASSLDQAINDDSNVIGLALRYGMYDHGDTDSTHLSLPLSYTIRLKESGNRIKFKMPIAMTEVEGARAFNFGLGMEFGWKISDTWELSPAFNYAAVGSKDLGSVGQIASGALTSAKRIDFGDYQLNIGNMIGYYRTLKFSHDDYSFDPDIANTVFRNGIMISVPSEVIFKKTSVEFFLTDTRYIGSDLYVDQYNEIGFSFGYSKPKKGNGSSKISKYLEYLRFGLTYLYSEESKGFSVNMGYSF